MKEKPRKGPQDTEESLPRQEGLGQVIRSIHLPPGRTALKVPQTHEHLGALERKGLKEDMKEGEQWAGWVGAGLQTANGAERRARGKQTGGPELHHPVKLRELGEYEPCLRDLEECQSENEEWRCPQRGDEEGESWNPRWGGHS